MTDRHCGYVVTLAQDIREDDAQRIIDAIGMIRGVVSVEPVKGDAIGEHILRSRWRSEIIPRVLAALRDRPDPDR